MEKLRVLIADKDIRNRKCIAAAVDETSFGKVAHVSSSGTIALDWLSQSHIDVVLLDVFFLRTGGMNILKEMLGRYPNIGVVVTGTRAPEDANTALKALKLGAMDMMLKPSASEYPVDLDGMKGYLQALFAQFMINKVSVREENRKDPAGDMPKVRDECAGDADIVFSSKKPNGFELLLIASSTGGPQALERVICELPPDFDKPVLVVQHMPMDFTRILVESLNKKSPVQVKEAVDNEALQPGTVLIAPGDTHMTVYRNRDSQMLVKLQKTPHVNGVRPSADVLFRSVAQTCKGNRILTIILTGMGNDGTKGLAEMKRHCDCYCITQSESSCIVYGMPKSAAEAGMSDEVADIGRVAERIKSIWLEDSCK